MRLLLSIVVGVWVISAQAAPLVATGDSQTAERLPLAPLASTYPALLASRRGSTFTTIAVPNATSATWLATQVPQVEALASSACITVMIGINDGWIDPATPQPWPAVPIPAAQTQANIIAGVQRILNKGHSVTYFSSWSMWDTLLNSVEPNTIRAQKNAGLNFGFPILDAYAITANCWITVPGEPLRTTCIVDYGYDQPNVDPGKYGHPAAPGHLDIANLCNLPANANACACKP